MRVTAAVLAAVLLSAAPVVAQSNQTLAVGSAFPTIALTDQFGETWTLDAKESRPVVLVLAGAAHQAEGAEWAREIAYGGTTARVVRVLDVSTLSRPVQRSLRRRLQGEDPIAVDWDGSLARALQANNGRAVVVTIRRGVITGIARGEVRMPIYADVMTPLLEAGEEG